MFPVSLFLPLSQCLWQTPLSFFLHPFPLCLSFLLLSPFLPLFLSYPEDLAGWDLSLGGLTRKQSPGPWRVAVGQAGSVGGSGAWPSFLSQHQAAVT